MFRLYQAEWKKLWKSKLTLLLILALGLFTVIMDIKLYNTKSPIYSTTLSEQGRESWTFQDEEGTVIKNGLPYYQFANQQQEQFAGPIDEDMIQRYLSTYRTMDQKNPRTTYDDAFMKEAYGEDYVSFLQKLATPGFDGRQKYEELAKREIHSYMINDRDQGIVYLSLFYESDHLRSLYQLSMFASAEFMSSDPAVEAYIPQEEGVRDHMARIAKADQASIQQISSLNSNREDPLLLLLAQRHTNNEYGSVVGNNLFVNAIGYINVITLAVIAIVLANSFAMEASTKVDQIACSSVFGTRKTVMAKLLCGISFAIVILLFQYLILFVISMMLVPLGDISLLCFAQANILLAQVTEYFFTYQEIIGGMLLVQLVAVIATAVITMLLSYTTRNRFATVTILLLILLGGKYYFLMNPIELRQLRFLFPATMMDPSTFFQLREGALPYLQTGSTYVSWRLLSGIGWICISSVLCAGIWYHSKQRTVKNC